MSNKHRIHFGSSNPHIRRPIIGKIGVLSSKFSRLVREFASLRSKNYPFSHLSIGMTNPDPIQMPSSTPINVFCFPCHSIDLSHAFSSILSFDSLCLIEFPFQHLKPCKSRDGMEGLGERSRDWSLRRGDIEEASRRTLPFRFPNVAAKTKMKSKYIIIEDLHDELNCIDQHLTILRNIVANFCSIVEHSEIQKTF